MTADPDTTQVEVVRLPLWKACLEDMLSRGVDYGDTYATSYFEEKLKAKRNTMEFSLAISSIRTSLLEHGKYLSGRGQKGESFVVLNPEANASVMQTYQREAIKALKKGVILGTSTDMQLLTDDERRRHEATLERMSIRAALVCRSTKELRKLTGGS